LTITLHWIALLARSLDVCSDGIYQLYRYQTDKLRSMELRHLRYFCAVAEELSFTLAARRLHVSQSGVSGQVRNLEQELGVALFYRNQRNVSLTPEGSAFLGEVRDILERTDRAAEMVAQTAKGHRGKLKIGLCGPATAPFLPRLIREFRKRHAGISLSLKDLDPAHQPEALVNGQIDVGFTRGIPASLRGTLASEVFVRESLIVALPHGHKLENTEVISLKDLAGDRFVLYARENAPELFDSVLSLCRRSRFSPNIVDTPSLWQSVLTMIEAGEGVSIVPESVKHLRSRDVTFRPLQDRGCTIDVVLAWRANAPDAVLESFLALLRAHQAEVKRSFNQR
jgi:DNA-binding transcriptional LysR family regulator